MRAFPLILALSALAMNDHLDQDPEDRYRSIRPKQPKNRHNLTPEQRAKLDSMSPKEKKRYIKGLYKK